MTAPQYDRGTHAQRTGWLSRLRPTAVPLLALVVLVWLLAELAQKLTFLIVAVLLALLVAGVFAPTVHWATRKGLPRWVAAAAVVVVVLAAVSGAAGLISASVADQLPQLRDQLTSAADDLSARLGVALPSASSGEGSSSSGSGSSVLSGLASSARVAADVALGFFLTLALAFLFLKDGSAMWGWLLSKLGGTVRENTDAAGRAAWGTVGAYVRGLTIVAVFDAVGIGVGLLLLGVPLALTLALLQFLASYVPTVGAFVAGAVAVAVAYVDGGLVTAALVAGLVVVVQQIGNDVIEPYVMGRQLPINAAIVLIAVTSGGLLWGIAGALLFVPLTAAASAAAHELWERHGSRPVAGG